MKTIELEVFADEIINEKFICLGCLFVPSNKKKVLVSDLINHRCLFEKSKKWVWNHSDCPFSKECKEQWHNNNKCEIHHTEIRKARSSNSQIKIAKRWLNYLIEHNRNNKELIFINILYIDLEMLEINNFGTENYHNNIYNKFFRTVMHYGITTFFSEFEKVIIKKVYHDKGSQEFHEYFPELNLMKLNESISGKCIIEDTNINFLESDHNIHIKLKKNSYIEAHLIQYIDLIIGTVTQNIFYLSDDSLKKEIAMILRPLIEKMLKEPHNRFSEYGYYKKQKISFFPKFKLEDSKNLLFNLEGNLMEVFKKDQFYSERELKMPYYDVKQSKLNSWVA